MHKSEKYGSPLALRVLCVIMKERYVLGTRVFESKGKDVLNVVVSVMTQSSVGIDDIRHTWAKRTDERALRKHTGRHSISCGSRTGSGAREACYRTVNCGARQYLYCKRLTLFSGIKCTDGMAGIPP